MTDFVISEDELSAIEIILKQAGIPIKRNVLLTEIRSRKLSTELETAYRHGFNDGQAEGLPEALKAERERVRPEVWQFALLMEKKLKENDHKKSWKKCKILYLIKRLKEEVKELEDCFWIEDSRSDFINIGEDFMIKGKYSEEDVIKECADVSNFSMMIAWNMRESLRGEGE